MEMINTIYKLVKEDFKRRMRESDDRRSICGSISNVYIMNEGIDAKDQEKFDKHFLSQKPNWYTNEEFLDEPNFKGAGYWWENEPRELSDASRLRFLDKMIKITETENHETTPSAL